MEKPDLSDAQTKNPAIKPSRSHSEMACIFHGRKSVIAFETFLPGASVGIMLRQKGVVVGGGGFSTVLAAGQVW